MVDVAIFSPKNHNGLSRWRNIAITLKTPGNGKPLLQRLDQSDV